jgi:hypothetical protein
MCRLMIAPLGTKSACCHIPSQSYDRRRVKGPVSAGFKSCATAELRAFVICTPESEICSQYICNVHSVKSRPRPARWSYEIAASRSALFNISSLNNNGSGRIGRAARMAFSARGVSAARRVGGEDDAGVEDLDADELVAAPVKRDERVGVRGAAALVVV